ncbi:DUF1934 domain-containing protein [Apilactobacillus apinorum]|uniref:DUF1934 domain-containing protein n=1 Tax=Apilactobacillus apinorum TaxID=1218495 RepID=UPI0006B4B187|nr:DUF1934 domain-containing protein [Apilactobacillus apinorum]KOY69565.1 Uncharacterized protein RZ74_02800 [Apilactobacillus apinorum]CAI2630870.1 Uncharacterized protein AAPFHON13_02900 [Apilactobacillus apinorum]
MEEEKNNQVAVNLKTTIFQDGERQDFEFVEQGNLVKMSNGLYLRFKEHQDDKEVATVTIKITDEHVQLTRKDEMGHQSRLIFNEEKIHKTAYQTQFGALKIEVKTKEINCEIIEDDNSGSLMIDYELYTGGMIVGEYNIRLHFSA